MKKSLLTAVFLICSAMMFGQFNIVYNGNVTNTSSTSIMMYLEVDSVIVDSVLTNSLSGNYQSLATVATRPFMIRILMTNCHGVQDSDWHSPSPTGTSFTVAFDTLNYCPPVPCQAGFNKFQAVDPVSRLPIPNQALLIDNSVGSALTYSWDFGDGSAPQTGLNTSHTYATFGSYNVCLTITSTTLSGLCTSIFCDTLTVDSSGNVRSAFTVNTGGALSSIEEVKNINSINLYPNPAQDRATIDFESTQSSELTIRIIDTKGSVLFTMNKTTFSGSNKIELSTLNLQEGMYLIQLQESNSLITKRLQIVR